MQGPGSQLSVLQPSTQKRAVAAPTDDMGAHTELPNADVSIPLAGAFRVTSDALAGAKSIYCGTGCPTTRARPRQ